MPANTKTQCTCNSKLIQSSGWHQYHLTPSYRYGNSVPNNAIDRLGFTQPTLVIPAGSTLVAQAQVRLNYSNCYYLTCRECDSQGLLPQPWATLPILAKISTNQYGYISQFLYPNNLKLRLTAKRLENLTFQILDELYVPVELPISHPITFALLVEQGN